MSGSTAPGPAPAPSSGSNTKDQDTTKAVALPILAILAVAVGIFLTWKNFSAAAANCRSDTRLTVLFVCSVICACCSLFILVSAGWQYGFISFIWAYLGALASSPGLILDNSGKFMATSFIWFLILVGIPDGWMQAGGILGGVSTDSCNLWYPTASVGSDHLCKEGYVTFILIVSMVIIVMNLFNTMMSISFYMEGKTTSVDMTIPRRKRAGSRGGDSDDGTYQAVGGMSDPSFVASQQGGASASSAASTDTPAVSGYAAVA